MSSWWKYALTGLFSGSAEDMLDFRAESYIASSPELYMLYVQFYMLYVRTQTFCFTLA